MNEGRDPIVEAFDRLASARPAEALVVSPSRSASVGDVAAAARAAAAVLGSAALAPGALVGLAAPNGVAFLAGLLALRRVAFPVLLLDGAAPEVDQRRACAALGAHALLTAATAWPQGPSDWGLSAVAGSSGRPELSGVDFVKLTSGSTATPRGVGVSSEAILADDAALVRSMGLRPGDRILGAIPLSHSYGFVSVAVPALVRGSTLVLPDDVGPLSALLAARAFRATVFPTAPAYLQALSRLSRPPEWPASVRLVLSAGAPLTAEVAARFRATYARPVHVFYGASECGGICYDREGGAAERGTVGEPVEGVRVTLEDVGGGPGEGVVTVASPAVGARYLPDEDPRLGDGRFRTSDIAAWEGGELRLRGRADALINIKGKKVSPSEIESVLARLQGVEEAVAFGVPAPDSGGDVLRAVVACPSGSLTYLEVVAWCRRHLPEHKVPRSVVLVPALPRTSRGKLDRALLLALGTRETA